MSALTLEGQTYLQRQLSTMGSEGRAEGESVEQFPRTFYPVAEHARAFDPDVVLVVGPRGAGKTALFKAVIDAGLLPAVKRHAPNVRLPPIDKKKTEWIKGYPLERRGFEARGLRGFIQQHQGNGRAISELWFAYLVRLLHDHFDDKGKTALQGLREIEGGAPIDVHAAFAALNEAPLLALDRLDERLERQDAWVFVAYDELDTLGSDDWAAMTAGISGLVAFWAGYTRRWKRIRAKLFLRTDLFQRYATTGGADLAKLAANRVELVWSDRNLYSMLLKRIANSSEDLREYIGPQRVKQMFERDPDIGYVPKLARSEEARPIIDRMVGPYMGANVKKGLVFRWLLDHIRDGRGHALPRPLVKLIEEAARFDADSSVKPRLPRLLQPTALRRALDVVSQLHVKQSLDEWPWLVGLRERLRGEHVPWERRQEVEHLLEQQPEAPWGERAGVRPPYEDPNEFVAYLVEVGVFRSRSDLRIDVPDLFLSGLALKRKGGVRRK